MTMTNEEMQAILDAQTRRTLTPNDPFAAAYGQDPRLATMPPPNMSVAPPPPPVAPIGPPPPVGPPTTLDRIKQVQALRKGQPPPTEGNLEKASTWGRMNAGQREDKNNQLAKDSLDRDQALQTQGNNFDMALGNQKIADQEGINQAEHDSREAMSQHDLQLQAQREKDMSVQEDALGKYDAAIEEMRNFHVDPDRYQKSRTTGQSILAGIGLLLGSFGGAKTGGRNPALEQINLAIDRDMHAQEVEGENKKAVVGARHNYFNQLSKHLGDKEAARSAFKATYYQQALNKINDLKAKATTDDQRRNLASAYMQIEGQKQAQVNQLHDQLISGAETRWQANAQAQAAGQAAKLKENKEALNKSIDAIDKQVAEGTVAPENRDAAIRSDFKLRTGQEYAAVDRQAPSNERIAKDKMTNQQKNPHLGQRSQGQIVAARNALGAVNEVANVVGIKRDKSGQFEDPGLGSFIMQGIPLTDMNNKINAAKNTLIAEIGKAQSGQALTEGEAHVMLKQIDEIKTPGQFGSFLRHYEHTMKGVEENVRDVAASSGAGSDNPNDEQS